MDLKEVAPSLDPESVQFSEESPMKPLAISVVIAFLIQWSPDVAWRGFEPQEKIKKLAVSPLLLTYCSNQRWPWD